MDKRETIIQYINNLDNDEIDDLYNTILGESNKKTDLIIDRLLPFITYIYLTLNEEQIKELFTYRHN
jgi:hypothetical protein